MTSLYALIKSAKSELIIVFSVLATLIVLPLLTVVVFASSGISLVSSALAAVNPVTHSVEIFDSDGNKQAELELSTAWPTRGVVTDEFGTYGEFRQHHKLGPHRGIDIANDYGLYGEPVTPFLSGKVVSVDNIDDSSCGVSVRIAHGNNIESVYCHLLAISTIEHADVKPGDIIGLMGSSGTSTGSHLHFGVEVYGIPVNPRTFMVGDPERSTPGGDLPITF